MNKLQRRENEEVLEYHIRIYWRDQILLDHSIPREDNEYSVQFVELTHPHFLSKLTFGETHPQVQFVKISLYSVEQHS